jgi:inosine/xanthosine triphosphatase
MEQITVAVGSMRAPKLNGVSQALETFGSLLHPGSRFHVIGVDVPTGVSHTPTSRTELMAGARRRCEALIRLARKRAEHWQYCVGLEGGLDVIREHGRRLTFLESWACVTNDAGREGYGRSGAILLPEPLASAVLDDGAELSSAIDAYTDSRGIRDAQGAVGVLTLNLITREEAFRIALIGAFAPFFNACLYSGPVKTK